MEARAATAFAPGVISNFFSIHDEALAFNPPDLSLVGATGGGFTLSRGASTRAAVTLASPRPRIAVTVNGDPRYKAATTTRAVELLLDAAGEQGVSVQLEQEVEVPIGQGFGSSSASSLSAVMAVASALELRLAKRRVAFFAHAAEILCQTGLGTVSSTFDHTGAGIIVRAGGPGVAEVRQVKTPRDAMVVTAAISAERNSELLSSPTMRRRVNRLGDQALKRASDLTLESLLAAGEAFAEGLGMETPTVKRLIALAKEKGAMGASQNMVGQAVHAVVWEEDSEKVAAAFRKAARSSRVDVFRMGESPARVTKPGEVSSQRGKSGR